MLKILSAFLLLSAFPLKAEEKTCAVKGMHCESCVSSVKEKVCTGDTYSACEVKVTDKSKKLGEIHLKTKDAKLKIDDKQLTEAIADAGYSLEKCKAKM